MTIYIINQLQETNQVYEVIKMLSQRLYHSDSVASGGRNLFLAQRPVKLYETAKGKCISFNTYRRTYLKRNNLEVEKLITFEQIKGMSQIKGYIKGNKIMV